MIQAVLWGIEHPLSRPNKRTIFSEYNDIHSFQDGTVLFCATIPKLPNAANSCIKLDTSSVIQFTQSNIDWGTERLTFFCKNFIFSGLVRRFHCAPTSGVSNVTVSCDQKPQKTESANLDAKETANLCGRHEPANSLPWPRQNRELSSFWRINAAFNVDCSCMFCNQMARVNSKIWTMNRCSELDKTPSSQIVGIASQYNSHLLHYMVTVFVEISSHTFIEYKTAPCLKQLEFCFALSLRPHSQPHHAIHRGLLPQIPLVSLLGLPYAASNNILI